MGAASDKTAWWRAAKIVVSLGLLAHLASLLDFRQVAHLPAGFLLYIGAGANIFLLCMTCMALRWQLILRHSTAQNIPIRLLYRFYLIGQSFNLLLPGAIGGDGMRMLLIRNTLQLSSAKAAGIVLTERLYGLLALMLIFALGCAAQPNTIAAVSHYPLIPLTVSAFTIAYFILRHYSGKLLAIPASDAARLTVLSLGGQLADVVIVTLLGHALGLTIPFTTFLLVMPFVYIVTMLPISFGGVGVRESAFVLALHSLGIDTSLAVLLSLSLFVTKVLVALLGIPLYLRTRVNAAQ